MHKSATERYNRYMQDGVHGKMQIPVSLPDKDHFFLETCYLDAAYTHPIGKAALQASKDYLRSRATDLQRIWPAENARDLAVSRFATLINADATEIAVVPSTVAGENLLVAALGLGPGRGVVTDPFHYSASLVMYGEQARQGMPLVVLEPQDHRIDYAALEQALTPEIKLVALSLVASGTGYLHDLKRVCEIAHRKGALVYADIIQAVGAIPFDVRESGVDFCCAGHYKWLMGEFGAAFMYVRQDRLPLLKRVQLGWHGYHSLQKHYRPLDPPGPLAGSWVLGEDTASIFEVSTDNWFALASVAASLDYILSIGVARIEAHRLPLLEKLQDILPTIGFTPLTPRDRQGSYVVFQQENAGQRYREKLQRAGIRITLDTHTLRISPSLFNDMADIDALIAVLASR